MYYTSQHIMFSLWSNLLMVIVNNIPINYIFYCSILLSYDVFNNTYKSESLFNGSGSRQKHMYIVHQGAMVCIILVLCAFESHWPGMILELVYYFFLSNIFLVDLTSKSCNFCSMFEKSNFFKYCRIKNFLLKHWTQIYINIKI